MVIDLSLNVESLIFCYRRLDHQYLSYRHLSLGNNRISSVGTGDLRVTGTNKNVVVFPVNKGKRGRVRYISPVCPAVTDASHRDSAGKTATS